MKIAFFGDTGYVGTRDWVAWLAGREGVDLHAIVLRGSPCDIEGVTFHPLPGRPVPGKAAYLACIPDLRKALRAIDPDLLIAYRVVSYGFAASMSGFRPLVLAAQGQYIVSPESPRFLRVFARAAVRRADMIHAWAPPMTENLVGLGAPPDRILTLPRGVDDERFAPGPDEGGPPAPLTLITTRKLEPYYNIPTLLQAVSEVRSRVGEVRYLIAGEGGQRAELEAMSRRLGLEGTVRFLGTVSRDELPDLLRSCHLYVSTVPTDGTSSSMLEAMASGVPPIVTDNESNRHWVRDRREGRLVPPFDAGAVASAIIEAWEDPAWRRSAGRAGLRAVRERASWKTNMGRFMEAYRMLAAGKDWRRAEPSAP